MSHLARDLDRHLVWIEKQARELQTAVQELLSEANAMRDGELWNDMQVDTIRSAINDWADNCGRSISNARFEASELRKQLIRARCQGDDSRA